MHQSITYFDLTAWHPVLAHQARRSAERPVALNNSLDSRDLLKCVDVLRVVAVARPRDACVCASERARGEVESEC
jgi:hypothetical protein